MGNLVSNETLNGESKFQNFKSKYRPTGSFDSQDFLNQNCEIWYQKENKDNRVLVLTHWLQSKIFLFYSNEFL